MNSWTGFLMSLAGIAMGFTSLFIPPQGVIDSSVLIFIAQIFIFASTLLGVKLPKLPLQTKEDKTK